MNPIKRLFFDKQNKTKSVANETPKNSFTNSLTSDDDF